MLSPAQQRYVPEKPTYTTHPKAIAGIVLMASLMLFSVLFTIFMAVSWAINPIESRVMGTIIIEPGIEDYFTTGRVAVAGIVSGILTALFWMTVDEG